MNRGLWVRAIAGFALVGAGALAIVIGSQASREMRLTSGCRMPARELGPASGRAAVVLHGLAANERIMEPLGRALSASGWRVILFDLPGHGSSPEPFSFARAEDCVRSALGALARSGEIDPRKTMVIGHSLGGALAVRLAGRFPAAATIAISPAPIPPPERLPGNLLIFSASLDLKPVQSEAEQLKHMAGGERTRAEDFAAGRAAALLRIAGASHSSLIVDPRVWQAIRSWGEGAVPAPPRRSSLHFPTGLLGTLLGVAGLIVLFPVGGRLLCGESGGACTQANVERVVVGLTLLRWAVASLAAALILAAWHPRPVRMFAGDYLSSFVFLAGLALLALHAREARQAWQAPRRAIVFAAIFGLATVFTFGAWLNWRLTEAWLIGPRWCRFGILAALSLPYLYAEEAALGSPGSRERFRRFGVFLLMRLVLWLALVGAYLVLASSNVLLLLMVNYFVVFSILQRLASDGFRRNCNSAPAAALFDAILAGWFFAMIFPLR